ncbi:hypothetical protein ANCDUO_22896, partial [Ancylostoma duodenale]
NSRARNNDIGIRILSALIEQKPIFAKYYGFETSLSKEELQKSELFLLQEYLLKQKMMVQMNERYLQAQRIQNFLDTVVSSLGANDAKKYMNGRKGEPYRTSSYLSRICSYWKKPANISTVEQAIGVNFGADNWLVFKKVTVDQVVSLQKKPSVFSLVAPKDFNISEIKMDNSRTIQRKCMVTIGWNRLMGIVIREMKRVPPSMTSPTGFPGGSLKNVHDF